jgi:hypothetical protein
MPDLLAASGTCLDFAGFGGRPCPAEAQDAPALGMSSRPPGEYSADPMHRLERNRGVTFGLVTLMVIALFVEVWSHGQPGFVDRFFSPWHAGFILAFLATAIWILWPLAGRGGAGLRWATLPRAYRLDVTGLLAFAVGLTSDVIWHSLFGVEASVEALTSPAHVVMVTGTFLLASAPFRRAWEDRRPDGVMSLRAFLPALLSLTLLTSMVAHILIYLWGYTSSHYMTVETFARLSREISMSPYHAGLLRDVLHARGIGNIYLSNVVLLAPVLMMLSRWHIPFGSVTIFFTGVVWLMAAVTGFFMPGILAIPVAAGLIADWMVQAFHPSPRRLVALRVFATVVPLLLWGPYVLAVHLYWGVAWSPTLWAGMIMWTAVEGFGLSLVATPGR